jgi:hypothetical protein
MSTSAAKTKPVEPSPLAAKTPSAPAAETPAPLVAAPPAPVAPAGSSLARNNLVWIVGAIVLLEAGLLAAVSFGLFPRLEKGPLLWAASLFPLLALFFLGWFITRHGNRLYAEPETELEKIPSITPLSVTEQREKVGRELAAFADEAIVSTGYQPDEATLQEMCTTYLLASDLALRQLGLEHPHTLRRYVAVEDTPFDSAIVEYDRLFAVELKLLPTGDLRPEILHSLLDRAENTARRLQRTAPRKTFTLLLILVVATTAEEREQLREDMLGRLGAAKVDVDLVIYDYNELHRNFARELIY